MKHRGILITVITTILSIASATDALGTIATPDPISVKQPDGSVITIILHGDEFYSWITDTEGNYLEQDSDGWYRKVPKPSATRKSNIQSIENRYRLYSETNKSISMGEKHFLVILIEFSDLEFTVENPNQAFHNLLNQQNYSANGGTGCVKDYYYDNSNGQFNPVFDVIGPIKVSRSYSYYGKQTNNANDSHPDELLAEACDSADKKFPDLDFSIYDIDKDGNVDNVFYYFAGHNQAEGAGSDYIWPHSWALYYIDSEKRTFDGVKVYRYACSSEYSGSSGTRMCGIGTFCHEFGHVLGLPDFYDTDYEKNGKGPGLYHFSLMSSGNYNNEGKTPPYLTAEERMILGWMKEIPEWTNEGKKNIAGIQNNTAYKTNTNNPGEYFLYEVRTGTKWDKPIQNGMLVYHVDKSQNDILGYPASYFWDINCYLNIYSEHPCIHIEAAENNYTKESEIPFPGTKNHTEFNKSNGAIEWNGYETGKNLRNISVKSDKSIDAELYFSKKRLIGNITDCQGNTIDGATVSVVSASDNSKRESTVSDSQGSYDFSPTLADSNLMLYVSCRGYETHSEAISLQAGTMTRNIELLSLPDCYEQTTELKHFSQMYDITNYGSDNSKNWELAIKLSKDALKPYVGYCILNVSYRISGSVSDTGESGVIIYSGSNKVLEKKRSQIEWKTLMTEDISGSKIVIPDDTDMYIGYYLKNCTVSYPLSTDSDSSPVSGGFLEKEYGSKTSFTEYTKLHPLIISATVAAHHSEINQMDYHTISVVAGGKYSAGSQYTPVPSSLPTDVTSYSWSIDGTEVKSGNVTLTAGEHVIRLVLVFAGGNKETILQEITVE